MLISEFARTIYTRHVDVHTSTGSSRMGIFRNHIEPIFGGMSFEDISKIQIYDWRNSLLIRGYKPAMVNKIQVIFSQIIKLAYDLDITDIRRDELGFNNIKITGQPEIYLTDQQMQKVILACRHSTNSNLLAIIKLLALTGARKREILDLMWQNVFMEREYFVVPKSKNGLPRKIFLNEAALNILEYLYDSRMGENAFVFPNPITGQPYRCIHYAWNTARKKAGFPNLRIHDLRHSFASALVNKGVSIYDIQHLLGHQSIKTTQRYAHLDDQKLKESANKAGSYFNFL